MHNIFDHVKKNGMLLRFAGGKAQNNREIVKAAVTQNGRAFYYIGQKLINDDEIILIAVSQNVYAILNTYRGTKKDKKNGVCYN